MSKEDSFAWQKSAPFDTSKVLREIGSDLAIPAKDPIHPIPNVEKTFVPEKRDFAGRCNSPSSGLSSRRKCRLPTLCRGCQASQALPVHNLDGDRDGEDADGDDAIMKMPMVVKIRANLCHCYRCFPSAATKVKQTISWPKTWEMTTTVTTNFSRESRLVFEKFGWTRQAFSSLDYYLGYLQIQYFSIEFTQ